jgi:hypothetical protein
LSGGVRASDNMDAAEYKHVVLVVSGAIRVKDAARIAVEAGT